MQKKIIAPSLLASDYLRLGEEVDAVLKAGADMIHLDIMDNHYVPTLSFSPAVAKCLRKKSTSIVIDVHLIIKPVFNLLDEVLEAQPDYVTFHYEATDCPHRILDKIKKAGCKAGLALNPETSEEALKYVIDKVDLILIMSVNPGFGGQAFIPAIFEKIRRVRKIIDQTGRDIRLQADGGVNLENIGELSSCGVDTFVAGSAIFSQPDYKAVIDKMRSKIS